MGSKKIKQYALVSGDHVRYAELRETAKFLLSDEYKEYKFKKVDDKDYIASNRGYQNWSHTGYHVYEVDHMEVLKILEKNKRSMFVWRVKKAAEAKLNECKTYSDFVELNNALNLGVEL